MSEPSSANATVVSPGQPVSVDYAGFLDKMADWVGDNSAIADEETADQVAELTHSSDVKLKLFRHALAQNKARRLATLAGVADQIVVRLQGLLANPKTPPNVTLEVARVLQKMQSDDEKFLVDTIHDGALGAEVQGAVARLQDADREKVAEELGKMSPQHRQSIREALGKVLRKIQVVAAVDPSPAPPAPPESV